MDNEINVYLLLYKVKNFPERWIVKHSGNYRELKNIIRKVDDNERLIGNYYIVKRIEKESIFNEKFKHFQIYIKKHYDELVYYL